MERFLNKKTITSFLLAFVIAVAAMLPVRIVVKKIAGARVFNPDADIILQPDMENVEVDKTSPFYDEYKSTDRINVMLVGLATGNTDTIMVASYNTKDQRVDIISVPRDTYYARSNYTNYAYNKINSIYRSEDIKGLAKACSELLYGMPIHYYAIVEYDDIRKIMDAIGGVYVDVPFRMKYDDPTADPPLHIDIPQGHVLIDSSNVEEYLRFRHGNPGYSSYYNGDLGRIQAQQAFVKIVLKKCLSMRNITDVATVALHNIQSDVTYAAVAQVATKALNGLSADDIYTHRLPGYDATLHNLSFWMPDETKIYDLLEEILGTQQIEANTSAGAVSEK